MPSKHQLRIVSVVRVPDGSGFIRIWSDGSRDFLPNTAVPIRLGNPEDDPSKIKYPNLNEVRILMTSTINFMVVQIAPSATQCIQGSQKAAKLMQDWIRSYPDAYPAFNGVDAVTRGYAMFVQEWLYFRHTIPLQLRLICEQILFDEGYPWRQLVTGFKPVIH